MGHSQYDDASRERAAWNAGKQVGTKRPLTQKQIWAVRFFLDRPSRVDHSNHMSTRQYARLVDEWVTAIGLRPEEYGTHSLRRTKASMIYKATGNIRVIPMLGHSKIENTVWHLGVDVEDAPLLEWPSSIRMARILPVAL